MPTLSTICKLWTYLNIKYTSMFWELVESNIINLINFEKHVPFGKPTLLCQFRDAQFLIIDDNNRPWKGSKFICFPNKTTWTMQDNKGDNLLVGRYMGILKRRVNTNTGVDNLCSFVHHVSKHISGSTVEWWAHLSLCQRSIRICTCFMISLWLEM
jgi:hypothetical protein